MGRVALESTSAAFQTAAKPSQLPTHETTRPGVLLTPGLEHSTVRCMKGLASTALGKPRARTRRTFGGALRILATQNQWQTTDVHHTLTTGFVAVVPMPMDLSTRRTTRGLHHDRRQTRAGCSRAGEVFCDFRASRWPRPAPTREVQGATAARPAVARRPSGIGLRGH